MRIQETDRILKESRYGRRPVEEHKGGVVARAWRKLTGLFKRH